MRVTFLSGAGNTFALVDAIHGVEPSEPAALARELCARRHGLRALDGLLLLRRAQNGGDVRMELVNADGSRAETCGNGLRCIAKVAYESGHVNGRMFTIEDDAGLHTCTVNVEHERVTRAEVHMGSPRIMRRDETLELVDENRTQTVRGDRVDVGNPHFVLFVPDVRTASVATLGPAIGRHAAFAHGTNVEFFAPNPAISGERATSADLRVWERGVGETQACGSGACAAAVAAVARGIAVWPLALHLPGGVLSVRADERGVLLEGPVEEIDVNTGSSVSARR